MAKKKFQTVLTETELEKKLLNLTGIFLFLFAVYRSVMSIGRYLVDYKGSWLIIQNLFLIGAVVCAGVYVYYITVEHPQKKLASKALFRRVCTPETLLLVGLMLWALIGCLSMKSRYPETDWWKFNKNEYYDLITQVIILYPAGCFLAARRDWKPLRIALHVVLIAATAGAGYILYRVFINSPISLTNINGSIGMGIPNNILSLSINCYYNTTGLWGYVVLFLCACMLVTSKKWMKIPYVIALPIHFMIIALSQSRTALIAVCATLGLMLGLLFLHCMRKKLPKAWIAWVIAAVIAAVSAIALLKLRDLLFQFYLNTSHIMDYLGDSLGAGTDSASRDLDITNLSTRGNIWKGALRSMVYDADSFFFGVSPLGVYTRMAEICHFSQPIYYTHNQVLEMGVAFGVPGMLMFVAFTGFIVWDCIKAVFLKGETDFREMLVPLGLFLVLLGNMTEATLIDMNYPTGQVFAIFCGWITVRARRKTTDTTSAQ